MSKQPGRKLPKNVDESFAEEMDRASVDQLKAKIVELQAGLDTAQEFKKSQAYLDAKAEWNMVSGPTNDTIKAVRAKTKYVIDGLKEKGAI